MKNFDENDVSIEHAKLIDGGGYYPRAYASQFQGLRITIANLGYMGRFVSRTNSNFCRTVLRLSDSVVTNTAHCYSRTII